MIASFESWVLGGRRVLPTLRHTRTQRFNAQKRRRTYTHNACTHTHSAAAELNYQVRRTAVDFGVPLLTNISLVNMFADAMERHSRKPMVGLTPDSLYDYYQAEKASEAWTSPSEFH